MQLKPPQRLRFIPFRKKDIVSLCLADDKLNPSERAGFLSFTRLLGSVFHFEFHRNLEQLKNLYAPLNPDRDTRQNPIGNETSDDPALFADALDHLLNKANYDKLDQQVIEAAFEESSLFSVKLTIDFDQFAEVLLYTRGEREKVEQVSTLFGLIRRDITFTSYDRVVIYIRYPDNPEPESNVKPGATLLKLFQNVPKADVEMLFPNTSVAMRTLDKLMIGVPALIGAAAIATTKAGASLLLLVSLIGFWLGLHSEAVELNQATTLAIIAGLGGLGSYIWKQFSNFKNRKLLFMQSLTQNLYFRNLDNNAGVFHRLIDDAEEEECKEAILAYYFLLTHQNIRTQEALDRQIETWFHEQWDAVLDFEVDDALAKLALLGLVTQDNDQLSVVSLEQACQRLDRRWDTYFDFSDTQSLNPSF